LLEVIENKGRAKGTGRGSEGADSFEEWGTYGAGEVGSEKSRPMLSYISYSVKSFYGTSILKIDTRIRTGMA